MKRYLKYLYNASLLLSFTGINALAQQHITVSSYTGQSEIKATGSVTLTDGFYALAGSNLRVYTGASFQSCPAFTSLPSVNQNYVLTRTFKIPGITNDAQVNAGGRTICQENQSIQYLDGLGRPIQNVTVNGGIAGHDLVQPSAYDAYGREQIKYQPYSVWNNSGAYRADALSGGQAGYYAAPPSGIKNTNSPFSLTVFEPSPLNRVVEQGAPGDAWQPVQGSSNGHTLKTEYGTNGTNDVKIWTLTGNGAAASWYDPGRLYKTVSKDENWAPGDGVIGTTEEFKDLDGQVVLKRVWENASKQLNTYYVYDDFGNLTYVLPPAVNENGQAGLNSFTESDAAFNQFIYAYHYDSRNRVVEKKIPGKGWEYSVYNVLDQLILTQDAVQRGNNQWLFTKYDALGRGVITGIYTDGSSRTALQNAVNAQVSKWESRTSSGEGYTNDAFPQSIAYYHTINYYDDYAFPGNSFGGPSGSQVSGIKTKSLPTGTKLTTLGTGSMLLTVNYYDDEGLLVQSKSQNHLGGTDVVDNTYNFADELIASNRTHVGNGTTTSIANRYEFDHLGRKLAVMENINNQGEVVISKLDYNEIGQLKNKNLHSTDGSSFLQNTQFAYNERGWLKNSTSNQFSIQLNYQDGSTPQYNGNIANQYWGAGSNPGLNAFTYTYDRLNRLTSASSPGLSESISYDVMGNILSLSRENYGTNNYSNYDGNQLKNISGLVNSAYGYDANGNLVSDSQKNISLTYNVLNLPNVVSGSQNITYLYDAIGTKLRKTTSAGNVDYIDGIQYKTNGSVDFIQTEEGMARNNGGNYSYEYTLSDHLGNNRTTFYKNPNSQQLEVLQRDDYYAFGFRRPTLAASNDNKYLYNKKELQEELGQYDYGARFYDPVIGRWNAIDPLAEDYDHVSPYNYVLNNPINFTDPDGMSVSDGPEGFRSTIVDRLGKIIKHENDGDNSVYQLLDEEKIKIGTEKEGIDYSKLIGQQLNQLIYDPNPIKLNSVSITAKKPTSAFVAIGLGLTLRTGGLWGTEGVNPEPVTKTIGAIAFTAYSAYVIADEATKYYQSQKESESLENRIDKMAEHTKGARPSTKGKHQKGQMRKGKDRGGEKGESLPPRKRPENWRGSWPPKK